MSFPCSASETGGEAAAGGEQQGERAQKKEGEVRREGTVHPQEPQTSADTSECSPVGRGGQKGMYVGH